MQKSKFKYSEPIDQYERDLEDALNAGMYVSISDLEETKRFFKEAAKNYRQFQISKPVTTRVNGGDLAKLKARAQKVGMPYQTLLSSLIHNFVEGKIKFTV
ncbi:hypothetical protein A2721_01595 [Candidatus Gottesmanbacteria bacterium RIFCSPHIGHO2_01_FULL_47_48]|uniref:Antitoxin n=1 Tax=Candidatus Gottesmanbacteria bacterium RIFCSPHIGHO2_01_FULL_47_48 TaxID=1798381 RepID=A0A1F6A1W5_9BACT|nr:MAG: hypothetical protein A2721_01595 [Candidatus Gottesmanbacteria bacterium RIFCSPHIGHO2_01_FULL_47_48]